MLRWNCYTRCMKLIYNYGSCSFMLQITSWVTIIFTGDESWKEMVQGHIGDDEDMQKELLHQLNFYGDLAEALKWAHFYSIDKEHWPSTLRAFADDRLVILTFQLCYNFNEMYIQKTPT